MKCWRCWLLATMCAGLFSIAAGWVVHHLYTSGMRLPEGVSKAILIAVNYPFYLKQTYLQFISTVKSEPLSLLKNEKYIDERFPCPEDTGFLMLAGVDPDTKKSNIRLIRMSNGKVVHSWNLSLKEIYKKNNDKVISNFSEYSFQIMDPQLLDDGGVIARVDKNIVKLDKNSDIKWVIKDSFHHSIHVDIMGEIWALAHGEEFLKKMNINDEIVKDDVIVRISKDGKIISKESFTEVLIQNNLTALVFGQGGNSLKLDPLHLNSLVVAKEDGLIWNKGDLLISARNLSAIFLYRPSTGKIIWHKLGPWLNQHDARFIDTRKISVFGNNVIGGVNRKASFITGTNRLYVVDMPTNNTFEVLPDYFDKLNVKTFTQGRGAFYDDGSIFIEETERNRHIRISGEKLICVRYNLYDEKRTGAIGWSTYISRNTIPTIFKSPE